MKDTAIVWLRNDLRLLDNPALSHACNKHKNIIIVYIYDDKIGGDYKIGSASKWWLHHSLASLAKDVNLVIRKGVALNVLKDVIIESEAAAVYWNRCYEPFSIERDTKIKSYLTEHEIECESFNGSLLFEPWEIKTKVGGRYSVYTPFWKACLEKGVDRSVLKIPKIHSSKLVKSDSLDSLKLLPTKPNWAGGISEHWKPGEKNAIKLLDEFIDDALSKYSDGRNFPALSTTSRLSPHLRFGEISPLYIWHKIHALYATHRSLTKEGAKFLSEIGWREFSYHLLFHFPDMPYKNFKPQFDKFEWNEDAKALKSWQKGMTGFPIVDAGMRELWHTGYMHNRVRMIVASFLIKDLFIDWRVGQQWFWDTLVDADLANNSCSWQWVAGSGADAAPYFRIFNPVLQGEKFDPEGVYVRKWVPELAELTNKFVHKPWLNPKRMNYPKPIVDHDYCRKLALQKYKQL
jgi:deoxyribodipyrimidine photo-lyase